PGGAAGCPSTAWVTRPGWTGSGPRCPPNLASRCAARCTTGWLGRPAWPPPGVPRTSCWDNGAMAESNRPKARDLNQVIRYTMWSVFRVRGPLPADRAAVADEVEGLYEQLADKDVVVRGTYDVA